MCENCWDKYGHHVIDTPVVRDAAAAIASLYEVARSGGRLHIVVDDWNLDDDNLDFCEDLIKNEPDRDDSDFGGEEPDQRDRERACLGALRRLTEAERGAALALADGFWAAP